MYAYTNYTSYDVKLFIYVQGLNLQHLIIKIAQVKLRCKNSSFADNYRYLSYKYNLTNSDWINDIGFLFAMVEIKSHSGINNLDVSTVKELCHMKDNSYYNILFFHDLIKLIEDICIN